MKAPYWFADRFQQIRSRCYRKSNPDYHRYGKRGITCKFLDANEMWAYMSALPNCSRDLTIDRINNDKNYEEGNLRWATWSQQCYNQQRNDTPVNRDVKYLQSEGVNPQTARKNLGVGMSVEEVLKRHKERVVRKSELDRIVGLTGYSTQEANTYIRLRTELERNGHAY